MSVYTGESRGELLGWINGLLGTDHKKLEQLGTGAVYCQIMDSIYGNLPMSKVKYNAKAEYEYLENFKILQSCFKRNGVDKPIPIDKLIKCKMQDNLEFCQWMKKFWDLNNQGQMYDADARSGGQQVVSSGGSAPSAAARRAPTTAARTVSRSNPISVGAGARTASSAHAAQMADMQAQVQEMQEGYEMVEKERAFYFDKLREVELLVSARAAVEGISEEERENLAKITAVLYSSEGLEGVEEGADDGQLADEQLPEDETY